MNAETVDKKPEWVVKNNFLLNDRMSIDVSLLYCTSFRSFFQTLALLSHIIPDTFST